jgi:hypothetical protein
MSAAHRAIHEIVIPKLMAGRSLAALSRRSFLDSINSIKGRDSAQLGLTPIAAVTRPDNRIWQGSPRQGYPRVEPTLLAQRGQAQLPHRAERAVRFIPPNAQTGIRPQADDSLDEK